MIDAQVGVLLFPQYALTFKGAGNILHRVFILDSYHNSDHTPNDFRPDSEPDLPCHPPPNVWVVWPGRIRLFCPNVQVCGVKTAILLLLIESQPPWSWIVNICVYDSTSGCFQGKSCDSQWERADQEGSAARCTQIYLCSYRHGRQRGGGLFNYGENTTACLMCHTKQTEVTLWSCTSQWDPESWDESSSVCVRRIILLKGNCLKIALMSVDFRIG